MKQYSEACDQNRDPILSVICREFANCRRILEIGSGTGQHAVYFARQLPHLTWQPSDMASSHVSINAWRAEAGLDSVAPPLELDVLQDDWPATRYDGIFSANTCHIMSWPAVRAMFSGVGKVLEAGGIFCLYGPFNYHGGYTSESNARFDAFLKSRDPDSGIRDFEQLDRLADEHGLQFRHDHEMPVNNRLLVWSRRQRN
jgi:cyclopropane fatty-acyl-phospholipid synthase-like methyltransferase